MYQKTFKNVENLHFIFQLRHKNFSILATANVPLVDATFENRVHHDASENNMAAIARDVRATCKRPHTLYTRIWQIVDTRLLKTEKKKTLPCLNPFVRLFVFSVGQTAQPEKSPPSHARDSYFLSLLFLRENVSSICHVGGGEGGGIYKKKSF